MTVLFVWTDDEGTGHSDTPLLLTAAGGFGSFTAAGLSGSGADGTVSGAPGASLSVSADSDATSESITLTAVFQCTSAGTVTFTGLQGDGTGTGTGGTRVASAICGDTTPTATATATGTAVPGGVTASAAPTTVGCNGSSFVTILVKTAAGANVPDGTPVTISTNLGTVNPTSATTSGGGTLTIFTAPDSQGGTATITATSGGVSGSTTVTVNCAAATATSAPPPPTATTAPTTTTITAPSTGDGGLEGARSAWRAPVSVLVIVASLLGGVAIVRRRA